MEVPDWIKAVFLVGSNGAFLIGVPQACKKSHWYEASLYVAITFISSWNHFTEVYSDACLFQFKGVPHLCQIPA